MSALRREQPEVVREPLRRGLRAGIADPLEAVASTSVKRAWCSSVTDWGRMKKPSQSGCSSARVPSTKSIRPRARCSARNARARSGVSRGGSTAMASAGTSSPSSSRAPRTVCAWTGQVSSQVV